MATTKSVYFIIITIFLVSFCGKCSSNQSENVQFITKLAQKSSEDWESDPIEPKIIERKLDRTRPEFSDDVESDQDNIENEKLLLIDDEQEIKEKDDVNIGRKRIVRQVNSAYSPIYPTLTPHQQMYPAPYRPATGVHGNGPYNYPNNQNSYSNPGYSQPNYYPPGGQNPFQNNTSYTNPSYNQGSLYNNQSNKNVPNPQYNQYSNQRYNTNSSFQGNIPQNGYNANQHTFTPTPTNQWTPGYTTNNTRYNPSAPYGATPKYPSSYNNNPSNTFHNFNNSTPRTVINNRTGYNPQYNPSNPPYQSYPHSTNTQHNNYNGSNQWSPSSSNTQTPYNYPGNNFPSLTSDGRVLNVSGQPGYNPSYPTNNNNPYNQQPYSANSVPNPYSQNYPAGSNGNRNNQYNKEPDHFFYSPGNKDTRYDPRNPSPNFAYSP